jgi:NAD(P)-dependent dehydrogenase (short-subunit alcohol dehydrogenase family)
MTLLLEPIFIRTATAAGTPVGSVRMVWVTSLLHAGGLSPGGISFHADGTPVVLTKFMANYMQSKIGDAWLADKFAKRLGEHGILSVVSRKFLDRWACADE